MLDKLYWRSFEIFCLSVMATCVVVLAFGDQGREAGYFVRFVFAVTVVSCGAWLALLFAKLLQAEKKPTR